MSLASLAALVSLLLVPLVSTAPASPAAFDQIAAGVPPSQDPFYSVPDGLDKLPPGTILKHRPPPRPIAAFGLAPVNVEGQHQILYRTSDNFGAATATVLTVLVPHNADLTKLVSYQVAEDAALVDCAPSYAFQFDHARGPGQGTIITEAELLLIEGALERGWVVIIPDFLGPRAAFLANQQAGHATLDGIRAAIASGSLTGIKPRPTISMWGYSGGSLATLWAAELQPRYAPELQIAGAAAGGIVPNITTVIHQANKSKDAGLIPAGILGLGNAYPDLNQYIDQHLRPEFRQDFLKARQQCLGGNIIQFAGRDIVAMFDDPNILWGPVSVNVSSQNDPGRASPRIPLFIYKSVKDEISPIAETDQLVQDYCASGSSIEYLRDTASSHTSLPILSAAKVLSWLIDTMDGANRNRGCTTKTVFSSLLDPATLFVLPKFLFDALLDLLGKPVGPPFVD
ncbi:hypothetical protein CDD82_7920 [Ophiocordyceps australis]|uniref:Secretory lipase family protein n=1 Tax=Ophiocordyceps australis TaxID=1399860 RepID=A0A2C5YQ99_9HYPO|nr:hypothetical protein CDD82_7920 [Ophiocordyceps australis]